MDAILWQKDLHLTLHTLNNVNEEILFPSFVINSKSKTSALSQTIQVYGYHTISCFLQGLANLASSKYAQSQFLGQQSVLVIVSQYLLEAGWKSIFYHPY